MFELLVVFFCCACLMTIIVGVYRLARWIGNVPEPLLGHLFAAAIWTAITACQTLSLLSNPGTPNRVGHVVVSLAGWGMVSSWIQFAERRAGLSHRQDRRWLPSRLFVQTLWGPLALGLGVTIWCQTG